MEIYFIFTAVSIAFLEILLSIDNAVIIGLLAREAAPKDRKKVLFCGLLGAFGFRGILIFLVRWLTKAFWIKIAGALYLILISFAHFIKKRDLEESHAIKGGSFWKTIIKIEFIDLVFAVDSVLAAVALTPHLWVVIGGVAIGMLAIRFIAGKVSTLIDRFPNLESAGYAIVGIVGVRMLVDALNEKYQFSNLINFHSPHNVSFWIFWIAFVALCIYPFI